VKIESENRDRIPKRCGSMMEIPARMIFNAIIFFSLFFDDFDDENSCLLSVYFNKLVPI